MRKAAFATGSLMLALALAGCGESETSAAPSTSGDLEQLAATVSSEAAQHQSANFTLDMDVMGREITAEGTGRFDGAESAMSMTANMEEMPGQEMQVRVVDQTIYVSKPAEDSADADATSWVRISAEDISPEEGASSSHQDHMAEMDQMLEHTDPREIFEAIEQAGSITGSERTSLDGAPVTHYTMELDLGELAEHGSAEMPQEAQESLSEADPLRMELWVNEDNLPVQVVVDASPLVQVADEASDRNVPEGDATITMRYTDWGTEVDVQPPPEDRVEELPSMPSG